MSSYRYKTSIIIIIIIITIFRELQIFMQFVETLRYTPEGRSFDLRWGH
jgi:hypothetical protein